jgi:hypothetical protein
MWRGDEGVGRPPILDLTDRVSPFRQFFLHWSTEERSSGITVHSSQKVVDAEKGHQEYEKSEDDVNMIDHRSL